MSTVAEPIASSAAHYAAAFQSIASQITDGQRGMLMAHYRAPGRTLTMTEIAHSVGYRNYRAGNLWYGRLGYLLCEELNWWHGSSVYALCTFIAPADTAHGEWELHMRPEVADALEQIGWV